MPSYVEPLPPEFKDSTGRLLMRDLDTPPSPAYPRAVEQGDTTKGEWLICRSTAGDEFGFYGASDPYVNDEGELTVDMIHFTWITYTRVSRLVAQPHIDADHVRSWRARDTFLARPRCVYGGCPWVAGPERLCDVHEAQWKAGEPMKPRPR